MTDSPYIVDITLENAQAAMVDISHQQPVLVDFWADWCGPCQSLIPILEKLAVEYNGKFILAKVNSDEQQELSQHFGVRSLPTVKLLKGAQVVAEFMGAQTEEFVRNMLDEHINGDAQAPSAVTDATIANEPPQDPYQQALQLIEAGNDDKALELLFEIYKTTPENQEAALTMAELLLRAGQTEEATAILDSLNDEHKDSERANSIRTKLQLLARVADLPDMPTLEQTLKDNPEDLDALHAFSNHLLAAEQYQLALDTLLKLLKIDMDYKEGIARTTMLDIFNMISDQPELISTYRRKMASALN